MKTKHLLAIALALFVNLAYAQRSIFEPQLDLRNNAERAEDQRLEMLSLQRETNEELRRQTSEIKWAASRASADRLERENAEDDARKAAQNAEADRVFEKRQKLRTTEECAPGVKYQMAPPGPVVPSTLSARNPYDPTQMPTIDQFIAAHKEDDKLDTIRKYRDQLKIHLLKNGEYDALSDNVDEVLIDYAAEQGLIDKNDPHKAASDFFAPQFDRDACDAAFVQQQSMDDGDTEAGKAALHYKVMLSDKVRNLHADSAVYQTKLNNARLQFQKVVTPEKIAIARRAAVKRGDIPFVFTEDTNGNKSILLGEEIKKCAGNDAALAKMFEETPFLDRNLIGAVRKKLLAP